MTNQLATSGNVSSAIESVLVQGDLSALTPAQRVEYYNATCRSLGLNPLTRPFDYITLNGKLTLYARKDAADQLRKQHGISIDKPDIQYVDDLIIVTVCGHDATGRTDSEIGVVKRSDMRGDLANAMMKAVTKAKRRLTLSICGLGMLDETETETIPGAVVGEPVQVIEQSHFDTNLIPALDMAEVAEIVNSNGEHYVDLPDDKLGFMRRALVNRIEKNNLPDDEKAQLYRKIGAIDIIISARHEPPAEVQS